MNPRVKAVVPNNDYTLTLTFNNGEQKLFDSSPFLTIGIFKELKDLHLFKTARVENGTVVWLHGQDLCPDTLYLKSV